MRILLQPAFVLHQRPYRETSLILDLFTSDYGRIHLISRGVRTSRSHKRALLQPFRPLAISWQGKTELMTLIEVEALDLPLPIDRAHLAMGFYLNELLTRVLPKQDPHPGLYTIYHQTLLKLANLANPEGTLRIFEKKLLQELGYALQLASDADGKSFSNEHHYCFYPEQGFQQIFPHALTEIKNEFIFSGKSILAIANETLDDENSLREIKRLMRLALAPLIGSRPLQSRKLFIEVL